MGGAKCISVLDEETCRKGPPVRHSSWWEDKIKMDLR
jgi:hypothetical protein